MNDPRLEAVRWSSFFFFLTGLRQAHDAQHYNLGLTRAATEWVLVAFSVLMLGSMHALQFNHLQHHKHCLDDEDVEARSAHMKRIGGLADWRIGGFAMRDSRIRDEGLAD